MRIFVVFLLALLIFSGCNNNNNNEDILEECVTQENLKQSFNRLKEIILENGQEEILYEGYNHTAYTYNNIDFSYRISGSENNKLEQISISDSENNLSYWLLSCNNEYSLETKDYPENIRKQKDEEAKNHFCSIILKLKH